MVNIVTLEKARRKDEIDIINFLTKELDIKVYSEQDYNKKSKRYNGLFRNNWEPYPDYYGYKLISNNEVVGYWAFFISTRVFNGETINYCNFSTWVVNKDYRKHSLKFFKVLKDFPDHTFTILSPNKETYSNFTKLLGFKALEEKIYAFTPIFLGSIFSMNIIDSITIERLDIADLSKSEQKLVKDHIPLNAKVFGARIDGKYLLLILKIRKVYGVRTAYLHFCNNHDLLKKNISKMVMPILIRTKTLAVIVESRYFGSEKPKLALSKRINNPLIFKSNKLEKNQIDSLYSERFIL